MAIIKNPLIVKLETTFAFDENSILIPITNSAFPVHKTNGTTANILYSEHVGILDEDGKEWSVPEWDAEFVRNNYSAATMPKPVGMWLDYKGLHYHIYNPTNQDLYSIDGGTKLSKGTDNTRMRHSMYNYTCQTSTSSGSNACITSEVEHGTAGKYNSGDWGAMIINNDVVLTSSNTGRSFTFAKTNATWNCFQPFFAKKDLCIKAEEMMIQNCEWLRDRHAICSGLTTNEPNGTVKSVSILNASGNLAAINEDMYFWIEGINTGLLAKYNRCTINNNQNQATFTFTLAMADAVYAGLIANGINMNDTGVNSTAKPILVPGAKGAEAIAVDGYWYITTPVISYPSLTLNNSTNIPDAPAMYYMKTFETLYDERAHNANGIFCYLYWPRRTTIFSSIITMLKTHEGITTVTNWTADTEFCWLSFRNTVSNSWCVNHFGYVYYYTTGTSCLVFPVVALK